MSPGAPRACNRTPYKKRTARRRAGSPTMAPRSSDHHPPALRQAVFAGRLNAARCQPASACDPLARPPHGDMDVSDPDYLPAPPFSPAKRLPAIPVVVATVAQTPAVAATVAQTPAVVVPTIARTPAVVVPTAAAQTPVGVVLTAGQSLAVDLPGGESKPAVPLDALAAPPPQYTAFNLPYIVPPAFALKSQLPEEFLHLLLAAEDRVPMRNVMTVNTLSRLHGDAFGGVDNFVATVVLAFLRWVNELAQRSRTSLPLPNPFAVFRPDVFPVDVVCMYTKLFGE